MSLPDPKFWSGKRVLLTGHTGFKGSWLTLWLHQLGATVAGLSLPPATVPSLFESARVAEVCRVSRMVDIRDRAATAAVIRGFQPEIVLHMAAQPLVRASYREPVETFATNIQGTIHVLDALRGLEGVQVAVMITTDKVYRNREWERPYREEDTLGGADPYSASKAACELVIDAYRDSFLRAQGVRLASARAGNVIGGGDWSEDRLIPDAVRAWQQGKVLEIRRPGAVRPWQHVLDPLAGYLLLAESLWHRKVAEEAYNFGPPQDDAASVRAVIEQAREVVGDAKVHYHQQLQGPHEAGLLLLESAKARSQLGYRSRLGLAEGVRRTLHWYQAQAAGDDARRLCEEDIREYSALP
jgi:CDP-glucose 4,6-dehydratase